MRYRNPAARRLTYEVQTMPLPHRLPRDRPVPADPDTILGRKEAARLANVSLHTFDQARSEGRLATLPIGPGRCRVHVRWGDVDRVFPPVTKRTEIKGHE